MKFFAGVSLLASLASAASIDLTKRDSPIDVKLEMTGNTGVKASVTNSGTSDLKILKTGTFLDSIPVEKVKVFGGSEKVAFDGVRVQVAYGNLDEAAFQVIPAGQTISVDFDIAELHNLSNGGVFDVVSEGSFSYAEVDSNSIVGAVPFASNTLQTGNVNGLMAGSVHADFHAKAKRATIQSDCTGTKLTALRNALTNCRSVAATASTAASSGNAAKFNEYFKTTSTTSRSAVAAVFGRAVTFCGSTTSGAAYYCSDVYSSCSSNVLAYTLPSQNYMVNCNLYFTGLSALSKTCHAQDQATTTLHEATHLTGIKGTTDQNGCYGYTCVRSLTSAQNLNHADTYTLYAQALYAGC